MRRSDDPARPVGSSDRDARASGGTGRLEPRRRAGPRIALLALLAVLVWLLLAGHPLVWAPAVLAAIVFGTDLALAAIDRRVHRERRLAAVPSESRERKVLAAEERVGAKMVLTLAIGLAAIALVVASAFLAWRLVGIGALIVFAWMALLGLPVWAAAVEEEVDEERERLTGEERAIR